MRASSAAAQQSGPQHLEAAARPGQRRTAMPEVSPSPTGPAPPGDSIILEEEIDPNYVPSQDEIDEYAKWLGMDLVADKDLQWIALEGLKAPLPGALEALQDDGHGRDLLLQFFFGGIDLGPPLR